MAVKTSHGNARQQFASLRDQVEDSREPVVIQLRGHESVDDPRALYGEGEGPPFPGTDHAVLHKPVAAALAAWRQVNGCAATPDTGRILRGPSSGAHAGQSAPELRWDACTSGAPVVQWTLTGSGHGWPGQTRRVIRESILGPRTTLIDAAEEAWRFAPQFSKP